MPSPYDELVRFYAARFQVPPELALAQMQQESHGEPRARSKVGALGLFQVMPSTSAFLEGFPEPAVMTGVWYQRHLYNCIQNCASDADRWRFALAAYNEGPGALEKARLACVSAGKDPGKWEDVSPFTPAETQAYVAHIWNHYQPSRIAVDPELQ